MLLEGSCPCGRTFVRTSRIKGRTDDVLIVKGVKFFPTDVEAILFEIEGTEPHYQILVDRKGAMDEVTVLVEVSESIFFDEMKRQNDLRETIRKRLASELDVSVDVKLVEKRTLDRFEGKATRVVDRRRL
jgi:phenylacetate-CoA ligase